MEPRGQLFTTNPKGISKFDLDAEYLLITRAGYDIPNTTRVSALSPSPKLFHRYITSWRGHSPYDWWPEYEKLFLEELKSEEKLTALRYVYKQLLMSKNIILICYCNDHRFCHRRLVAEFFVTYGVSHCELSPQTNEQISFL